MTKKQSGCFFEHGVYLYLRTYICCMLLHCTQTAGVRQTLRRTKNGIAELSQTAPPIFGWEAITLGIGPHSSRACFYVHLVTETPANNVT